RLHDHDVAARNEALDATHRVDRAAHELIGRRFLAVLALRDRELREVRRAFLHAIVANLTRALPGRDAKSAAIPHASAEKSGTAEHACRDADALQHVTARRTLEHRRQRRRRLLSHPLLISPYSP